MIHALTQWEALAIQLHCLYPFPLPPATLQVGKGDEQETGPVDELGAPCPVKWQLQSLDNDIAVNQIGHYAGDLDGKVDERIACAYNTVEQYCRERHDKHSQYYDPETRCSKCYQ